MILKVMWALISRSWCRHRIENHFGWDNLPIWDIHAVTSLKLIKLGIASVSHLQHYEDRLTV